MSTKVFVKDLQDLVCNSNLQLNNLNNYEPDETANPSNDSSSHLALSLREKVATTMVNSLGLSFDCGAIV